MLRKLYHGSRDIIKKPVYGYGKKYNDYGLGFYCTEDINMAADDFAAEQGIRHALRPCV